MALDLEEIDENTPRHPEVKVQATGVPLIDIGRVSEALKEAGHSQSAVEYEKEARVIPTRCHVLGISDAYVSLS